MSPRRDRLRGKNREPEGARGQRDKDLGRDAGAEGEVGPPRPSLTKLPLGPWGPSMPRTP